MQLKTVNWKKIGAIAGGVVGLIILTMVLWKWSWDARCFRGYDGALALNATAQVGKHSDLFTQYRIGFQSTPTESVPALLDVPAKGIGPHPCLIFLHGIGQKKEFLDEIAEPFMHAGYAVITFDQLGCGERKGEEPQGLDALKQLRRRCAQTVIDTRRTVDYLLTRKDIDGNRIALIGASLGGIVGVDAVAMEPRIRAAWIVYAGANIPRMLSNNEMFGTRGFVGRVFGQVGGFFLKPLDPKYHVGRIAPRPILLQNGKRDRIIPWACAQQLHDRAKEPKTIRWYDSDHIGEDPAVAKQVLADGIAWLGS